MGHHGGHGVSHHRGGMNNRGHGVSHRVSHNRGHTVGHGHGVGHSGDLRVGSGALVGHLGDVTGEVVGVVVDVLDPPVGKVDGVGSGHSSGSVIGLSLGELGSGVVVSHGVVVVVGGGLREVSVANGMSHGVS